MSEPVPGCAGASALPPPGRLRLMPVSETFVNVKIFVNKSNFNARVSAEKDWLISYSYFKVK